MKDSEDANSGWIHVSPQLVSQSAGDVSKPPCSSRVSGLPKTHRINTCESVSVDGLHSDPNVSNSCAQSLC